jgi:hypothetical protein
VDNAAVAIAIFYFQLFFLYLMNHKDIYLELLRKIELNPECTQRELSKEMGVGWIR